jgi:hypothetical protein
MIEYDHRDEILAFLLPASHSRPKFIEGPMALAAAATEVFSPESGLRSAG